MGTTPERAPGEAVHHGIQTRIAILVLVAALAPMALLGWASLSGVSELKDTLIGEHRTLVEIASAQVEQGLRATLEALAAVPAGEDPSGRMRNAQRDALRSAQLRSRLLADAFVVDGSGALVASASLRRGGDAFEPSEHPEIAVAIRRGIPSVRRTTSWPRRA